MEWRAYELHPEIPPEGLQLSPEVRAQMVGMSERLKQMAREAGTWMVMPEMIPNSRRASEAAEYVPEQGRHKEFHTGVFCQFWEKGQEIGRWHVLGAAAAEAGLDPKAMQQETESGKYQSAVDQQVTEAWSLGITGVPAYILNGKFAIIGVQPYEVFQEAMSGWCRRLPSSGMSEELFTTKAKRHKACQGGKMSPSRIVYGLRSLIRQAFCNISKRRGVN